MRFMRRIPKQSSLAAALGILLAGCGSASHASAPSTSSEQGAPALRQAHAQAIQPDAGVQAEASPGAGGSEIIGDPSAHAPPLSEVKRELNLLNLCGGTNNGA